MDELLNAVPFLLIGLEIPTLRVSWLLPTVSVVLSARLVRVWVPAFLMPPFRTFGREAGSVLTWDGLREGIRAALVPSMLDAPARRIFLPAAYVAGVFSVPMQGLTTGEPVELVGTGNLH